jgi:dihydropyrimidine dehydrogenase (NADP+)/dihydropyrimidine dehydrogenase (NAD+) subunit PreA
MEVATVIRDEFPGRTLSGIGGIETGGDAAQFLLLGCDTVQVCTGVMKSGYEIVRPMCEELLAFMERHKFATIDDFRGYSLPFFTSHSDLVRRRGEAKQRIRRELAERTPAPAITADHEWSADEFVRQTDALAGN